MTFQRIQQRHGLIMLLMLAMMATLVFGCGSSDPAGESSQQEPSSSAPEEESDAGAPASGVIKIGMSLAMTGPGSFYGKVMSRGAQTAVDMLNDAGGVEGYTLELVIEDHKSGDANAALTGGRKLLDIDQTPIILSSYTSPTLAIQPLAVEKGVLVFNGGGVGVDLIGKEALYNTRMLGSQIMPAVVRWAVEEHGVKRVATIFWNDAAGQGINEGTKETCAEVGCEVVVEEPHDIGQTSFSAQLARIKSANPDLVVIGSWGNDVGYIVNQARAQGIDVLIVGNEWTPDAQEIGGQAMEGYTVGIDRFDPEADFDLTKEFVEAYRDAYNEDPEFYAANYYEIVRMIVPELIKRAVAKGQDPSQPGALLEAMKEAVDEQHEFDSVYGGKMRLLADGTISKPAGLYEVENGELVLRGMIVEGRVQK